MKLRALVVEPTRLYQNILEHLFSNAGVKCRFYTSASDALEDKHDNYDFIIVSRTLKDISGEIFLQKFTIKHGVGDALTILLTANDNDDAYLEANKAGFKLLFNKKKLEQLQSIITKVINSRTLSLEARILLIEDSKSVADMVSTQFKEHRAEVDHVTGIDDAKNMFSQHEYDLVISDYYLNNDETGDELISFIRNYEADENENDKASIPILVMSGESKQEKRTAILRNGASDFMLKPYDNDELLVRSSNLITSHRTYLQAIEQKQQLISLALTDQLTGLYNRHSLYDLGPKYIDNAKRHEAALSIMVIDLDFFKKINDTYGHSTGDLVLRSVAEVLQDNCRTEDIVARFGGEEFVLLLYSCELNFAREKAENLRELIEDSKPGDIKVTASIGIAQLIPNDNFDTFFDRADKAVYVAKEAGRNRVEISN